MYALFMAAVCPKDQKKTEPGHEKTCLQGFSTRLYSNSSMLSSVTYKTQLEFRTPYYTLYTTTNTIFMCRFDLLLSHI